MHILSQHLYIYICILYIYIFSLGLFYRGSNVAKALISINYYLQKALKHG
jgi:hypothetical protein